jgi:hypothetical protein
MSKKVKKEKEDVAVITDGLFIFYGFAMEVGGKQRAIGVYIADKDFNNIFSRIQKAITSSLKLDESCFELRIITPLNSDGTFKYDRAGDIKPDVTIEIGPVQAVALARLEDGEEWDDRYKRTTAPDTPKLPAPKESATKVTEDTSTASMFTQEVFVSAVIKPFSYSYMYERQPLTGV